MADSLRQPAVRQVALSRRSTLAALTGDLAPAAEFARQAFQIAQAASLPDAGAVYWGQLFAIWLHVGLPEDDEEWMERELRDLVARSHLSVAHAAALVQIEAAHGATEQARGRLDELIGTGLGTIRPDMVYVWALTQLARGCVVLSAARHAPRLYRALAPYAGRAAVAAGAVMCSGSTDFYLAGLAALGDDVAAAERHYLAAIGCHRRLGARPMLAHTLREYALLLRQRAGPGDLPAASAALAEARAIAAECGMTRLLAALDQQDQPGQPGPGALTLHREEDFWLIGYADAHTRVPDSLGLRYLDLLVANPGRELAAAEMVRLAAATGSAAPGLASTAAHADGLHDSSGAPDDILDQQARTAYRQRLTGLDEEIAEADAWHDTERASLLRAEQDFLIRELAAATGLGGRRGSSARNPNEPGSTSPAPSGPRSRASATAPRKPPLTSTRLSGPEPAVPTLRRVGRAERPGRVPGGPAAGPGLCLLELRRQPEERGLVAEPAEEVHADRQAVVVPPERDGHCRVAGEVGGDARVAHGLAADLERSPRVGWRGDHRPDGQRRRGHRRGEEGVEAGEEAGDHAAESLDVLDGEQPLRGGDLLAGPPTARGSAARSLRRSAHGRDGGSSSA